MCLCSDFLEPTLISRTFPIPNSLPVIPCYRSHCIPSNVWLSSLSLLSSLPQFLLSYNRLTLSLMKSVQRCGTLMMWLHFNARSLQKFKLKVLRFSSNLDFRQRRWRNLQVNGYTTYHHLLYVFCCTNSAAKLSWPSPWASRHTYRVEPLCVHSDILSATLQFAYIIM